jgi:hypothetical protein
MHVSNDTHYFSSHAKFAQLQVNFIGAKREAVSGVDEGIDNISHNVD